MNQLQTTVDHMARLKFNLIPLDGLKPAKGPVDDVLEHAAQHNVGIATGAAAGLIVVIVTQNPSKEEEAATRRLGLPGTVSATYGKRSEHLYYRLQGSDPVPSTRLSGVRIVGDRNYIPLPGSIDPHTGIRIEWKAGREPWRANIEPVPPMLLELITRSQHDVENESVAETKPDLFNPVPHAVASSTNLSMGAKILYGVLARYQGKNKTCWPAMETLATDIGKCIRSVRNLVRELEQAGLVKTKHSSGRKSNTYSVLKPESGKITYPAESCRCGKYTRQNPAGQTERTRQKTVINPAGSCRLKEQEEIKKMKRSTPLAPQRGDGVENTFSCGRTEEDMQAQFPSSKDMAQAPSIVQSVQVSDSTCEHQVTQDMLLNPDQVWQLWVSVKTDMLPQYPEPAPVRAEKRAARVLSELIESDEMPDLFRNYLSDSDKFVKSQGHRLSLLLKRLEAYRVGDEERLSKEEKSEQMFQKIVEYHREHPDG